MDVTIRPARMEDHGAIASFTRDTFDWGDYVTRVYKDWIADPNGIVLVAAGPDDAAVAMAKVALLSPREAWAQGARVHPDWRRRGIATRLSDELWLWAAERGARVVRLAVEDWNDAARAQVEQMGFRPVSEWAIAGRPVGDASPVPEGNGGRRRHGEERLRRVPSSEADPAYLSWTSGPLSVAARHLFPVVGWTWRRLTADDLAAAARRQELWEGPPGWAVALLEEDQFSAQWVETSAADAYRMVRALVDAAVAAGAEQFHAKVPSVDWLVRALRRNACEIRPLTIYARALDG